ncbi:MAG: DUF732 domain-containing protein [Gordonia sp. (in: high G+C Gram-positive bacteria)]
MHKFFQLSLLMAGVALVVGAVSACSDDSTASAPINSEPITTTSMYSSPPGSSDAEDPGTAENSGTAENPDTGALLSSTPGSGAATRLPATAPNSLTALPSSFPGTNGEPVTAKGRKYLQVLKEDKVTFMGDTDNSVALNAADYVCAQQSKNADPTTVKAFVTALVGPGTRDVIDASVKADKVIKAAHDNYC